MDQNTTTNKANKGERPQVLRDNGVSTQPLPTTPRSTLKMDSKTAITHARTKALTLAMQSLVGALNKEQYSAFMGNWDKNKTALKSMMQAVSQTAPSPETLAASAQMSQELDMLDGHFRDAQQTPMKSA